jgi:hypothetical protein
MRTEIISRVEHFFDVIITYKIINAVVEPVIGTRTMLRVYRRLQN